MLRKFLSVFVLFGVVSQAQAAFVWYNNLTINSVAYYWDGANDVVEVRWNEAITTGCSTADSEKKASLWTNNSVTEPLKIRYSAALAAMTAGKKIDIEVDTGTCNAGYGLRFLGIRTHS